MSVRRAVQMAQNAAKNSNEAMSKAEMAEAIKILGREIQRLEDEVASLISKIRN